jgi:environmental stress-induced protein Ves
VTFTTHQVVQQAAPCLIVLADVAAQPWRNGGGVTRELLTLGASTSADDRHPGTTWRLRLSVAEVEADGPFSIFAGVTRWFAVLQGDGVMLDIDGQQYHRAPGDEPVRFDGAAATTCRLLGGATRDLNLMLRGDDAGNTPYGAGLYSARSGQSWRPEGAGACGVYSAQAATCRADDRQIELPANTLAWFDTAPTELMLIASDAAALLVACWIAAGPESTT